jgi:hypothetical protein
MGTSISNSSEPWAALVAVLRDEARSSMNGSSPILHSVSVKMHLVDAHPNRTLAGWGKTAPTGVFLTNMAHSPRRSRGLH